MTKRQHGRLAGEVTPGPADLAISRRALIQTAGIGALLTTVARPVRAAAPAALPIAAFYYDPQFQAARAFASRALAAGGVVTEVGPDISRLWFGKLSREWAEEPFAMAGLTTESAAYCLETLACDAGMRAWYRSVHKPSFDGGFRHRLCIPANGENDACWAQASQAWGAQVYDRIMLVSAQPRRRLPIDYAPQPVLRPHQPLVAWAIGPIARS